MLDYAAWVRRAQQFTEKMRDRPGELKVEIEVAPPLSDEAIDKLAQSSLMPIPKPLRRFWKEASGHCHCTYWWDTPEVFHPQIGVAFPDWSASHVWGGAEFDSAADVVQLLESCLDAADCFRDEYPKDARYWRHSLPLIPVGNGDFAGLYVRDNVDNPPVVFLCHDGCGGSRVIAPDFDTFLTLWEQLGYIGIHFLCSFINRKTGLIDPASFPAEAEAVRALVRGQVRSNLATMPLVMTEADWEMCPDPDILLKWLESQGELNAQKTRLFACACCRRIWDRMGEWSREAVEVAERFAEGRADEAELKAARAALSGGEMPDRLDKSMADRDRIFARSVELESSPNSTEVSADDALAASHREFGEAIEAGVRSAKSQGLMHYAAYAAVDGSWMVSWEITRHMDEPELSREKAAHADLVRRIFGNPFR